MPTETFVNQALTLEVSDDGDDLVVNWLGKSTAREPTQFILPVLSKVLDRSTRENKAIVIDFQKVEYLNSSSITPVIRILERAKRGDNKVLILYCKDLKWQALSFTALEVFHTSDDRIEIRGI